MGPIGCFHGCLKNEGVFVFTVVSSSNRGKNKTPFSGCVIPDACPRGGKWSQNLMILLY